MSNFNYVKFDAKHQTLLQGFKDIVEDIEKIINAGLKSPRAKALALTKLEECYMWIGKAVRDDQIDSGGNAEDLPQRDNN